LDLAGITLQLSLVVTLINGRRNFLKFRTPKQKLFSVLVFLSYESMPINSNSPTRRKIFS